MFLTIAAECSMALTFTSVTDWYHDITFSDIVTR